MRIILADHHVEPCWALHTLLDAQPDFEIIGEAGDTEILLGMAGKAVPDLVLLDSELPGINIEDLITQLHALEPRPTVVVMSSDSEDSRKLLKAGTDAFVSKADQPVWLIEILRKFENRSVEANGK